MRQMLYRQIHQDASTVPQNVKDDIGIAICESIKFNRKSLFYFNEKRGSIKTIADQYAYNLPVGCLGIIGPVYYTPSTSDDTVRYKLKEATTDELEDFRFSGNDYNSYATSGRPLLYSVDMADNRLLLAPIPSESEETLDFRYHADLGNPVYNYSGSAWVFSDGVGGATIADTSTYTNSWFKEAFDLIMWRAAYYLWSSIYGGTEESGAKAQTAMTSWAEAKLRLMGETTKRHAKRVLRKYI